MKCIAVRILLLIWKTSAKFRYDFSVFNNLLQLGAVEFLRKPISEDKLKNIWQHVVHKVC